MDIALRMQEMHNLTLLELQVAPGSVSELRRALEQDEPERLRVPTRLVTRDGTDEVVLVVAREEDLAPHHLIESRPGVGVAFPWAKALAASVVFTGWLWMALLPKGLAPSPPVALATPLLFVGLLYAAYRVLARPSDPSKEPQHTNEFVIGGLHEDGGGELRILAGHERLRRWASELGSLAEGQHSAAYATLSKRRTDRVQLSVKVVARPGEADADEALDRPQPSGTRPISPAIKWALVALCVGVSALCWWFVLFPST